LPSGPSCTGRNPWRWQKRPKHVGQVK
jgi:hypothetical protein